MGGGGGGGGGSVGGGLPTQANTQTEGHGSAICDPRNACGEHQCRYSDIGGMATCRRIILRNNRTENEMITDK